MCNIMIVATQIMTVHVHLSHMHGSLDVQKKMHKDKTQPSTHSRVILVLLYVA